MLFPVLETEILVQEKDKTRFNAAKSYAAGLSSISKMEIQIGDDDEHLYDITQTQFLDWQFDKADNVNDPETVVVSLILTGPTPETCDAETATIERDVQIVSATKDKLFSCDDDLRTHESDILKYVPDGRATFLDVHRRAQKLILDWLDTQGFCDFNGDKFTLDSITKPEEFSEWSTMMALRLIFEGVSNAVDDVFAQKAKRYQKQEDFYRNRAVVRLDLNSDGQTDVTEKLDIRSCVVVRR